MGATDLNGCALPQADRVGQIGVDASFLRVDLHEAQFIPYAINEVVQAVRILIFSCGADDKRSKSLLHIQLTTDNNSFGLMREFIDLLQANGVNFVVDI